MKWWGVILIINAAVAVFAVVKYFLFPNKVNSREDDPS
jgi:hypothetical protein